MSNLSAQEYKKITGVFQKELTNSIQCTCFTQAYIRHTDTDNVSKILTLCFDTEKGDYYEIADGETITVEGYQKSEPCANNKSYLVLYVVKTNINTANRKMLIPAFMKKQNKQIDQFQANKTEGKNELIILPEPTLIKVNNTILSKIQSKETLSATNLGETSIQLKEAQKALDFHNNARKEVGVAPLVWSAELASYAQEWANYLASKENSELEHRPSSGQWKQLYGENIYQGYEGYHSVIDGVKMWYNEINGFQNVVLTNSNFYGVGHYTQMVWRKTTQVGIGVAISKNGQLFVVANYNTPGNYLGEKAY